MKAIEELVQEHEAVQVGLDVLEKIAIQIDTNKPAKTEDIKQLMDFFKTFVDRCHHGKEEDLLFPALEASGIHREGGPVGVMLMEHTHGRNLVRAMGDLLVGIESNDADSKAAFVIAAFDYCELLRAHIEKENTCLFVMAQAHLTPETMDQLAVGFEKIEEERIGPGVHDAFHAMLDRMQAEYLQS